ncbi:hypothetical protein IV203_017112 [Nitzschia inconspicua]|uniref:Uncharacterized protein n=1 Tax=Nitzschia inconspicua TaxID=303405 RepID=A0A9K3KR69_9STRA|nr:hypothetical protein IV203_017112 [Nitzschia inconspicua]
MDVITIGNVADIVTEDPIVRKQLGRWDFVKHAPTILIAISMALVGGEGASFKNIMTRVHRCEGAAVRGVATYRLRIEEKETSFALNQFQFADVAWASNQYDDTRPRYRLWHDATKAKTAGWAQCSGCDVTIDGIEIKAIRRSRWVKKVLK